MNQGNPTNQDGTRALNSTPGGLPGRPGAVSHGPGHNKVKMHLTASKGKMPAEVYAHAVAARQKLKPRMPAKVLKHGQLQKKPNVVGAHGTQPAGVKGYDKPPMTGLA